MPGISNYRTMRSFSTVYVGVCVTRECMMGDRIIYEHFETISYLKVDQECDFLIIYITLCK